MNPHPLSFTFSFPSGPAVPLKSSQQEALCSLLKTNKKTNKQKRPSVGKGSGRGSFRVLGPLHLLHTHSLGVEMNCCNNCRISNQNTEADQLEPNDSRIVLLRENRTTFLGFFYFFFYLCPINSVYYTSSPHMSVNSCCLQESELLESRKQPGY